MKIDQLIYFNETARLEHIGKASKVLGISTSAISHSIASLEGELGCQLFEKKGKNIILTEQGRNLLNQSQDLINQFQNLKQSLLGSTVEKMHFRVAASHHLAHTFVTTAWSKLNLVYPKVSLEMMTYRSAEVVKAVLNREIDFGICFSPQSNPEIEAREIYHGELLITVKKDHPIFKLKGNRLKKLSDYPAVLPKAFQGIDLCMSHPMFEKFEVSPKPHTLTDSYDISLDLIKKTNFWGFTPDLLIKNKKEFKHVKPLVGWNAPFSISIIYLKKRFVPTFFKDFENQIKKEFL